jgi:hypothetical protein
MSEHRVGNKIITQTHSVLLANVNDQKNVDLSGSQTGSNTQKNLCLVEK